MPAPVRPFLRNTWYWTADAIDRVQGRRDSLTPPRSKSYYIGSADFRTLGQEFKRYMIDLGELGPDGRILDVGCGIGRMAVPLTEYLSPRGEYHGFDIVPTGIDWCRQNISSRFPNFHFEHVDVYNKNYNPGGSLTARTLRFPHEDDRFDVVLLASVFTHMLPSDLENYLLEVSRVLKPGGRGLITFFLLNPESLDLIEAGRSTQDFKHKLDGCLVVDVDNPEASIAYSEDDVRSMYAARGLTIAEPIRFGSWCGRHEFLSYQDIVVGIKAGDR